MVRKSVVLGGARRLAATYAAALAGIAADLPCYIAILSFSAVASILLVAIGQWDSHALIETACIYLDLWSKQYGLAFPLALAMIGVAHIVHRIDGPRRRWAFRIMFGPERIGRLLAGTILVFGMLPFRSLFNAVKNSIALSGFPYERAIADLDRFVHFGADPWRALHAAVGGEWALRLVELNYNSLWFVVCFGSLYWVATSPRLHAIRVRYLVTYILCWAIAGNLAALLFASAGPIFYGGITGDYERFAQLAATLGASAGQFGSAADMQAYLWQLHEEGAIGLGSGISAFPSMHVAIITLNVLFLREFSARWAALGVVYVVITLGSSVYLGWHYAVDGYAAIVLTAVIYWTVLTIQIRANASRRSATGIRCRGDFPTDSVFPLPKGPQRVGTEP